MTITFHSNSGPLLARRSASAIMLDFPLNHVEPYDRDAALAQIKVSLNYYFFCCYCWFDCCCCVCYL